MTGADTVVEAREDSPPGIGLSTDELGFTCGACVLCET